MKRFTAILLTFALLSTMTACGIFNLPVGNGTPTDDTPDGPTAILTPNDNQPKKPEVNISKTPAEELMGKLVPYEDVNGCFTATIPEGWAVSTAGFDMMYWIRIYDPQNPELQVFALLKTECLLMDQNSKAFYENKRNLELYKIFADMIVVEKVEDFYSQLGEFNNFMTAYEPTYAGFEYPQISNFEVLERQDYGSFLSDVAMEDSILHATFDNPATGQKGEGMFTGTLLRGFVMNGVGCNMMYNINAVTAPYGEFAEYEQLLTQIFSSIQYTDAFVSTVMKDQQIKAAGSAQLSQILAETSNIITEGWAARQTNYDSISAKYSDSILGYERVYDVETGEIYKAYIGFTDNPGMSDYYQPVTEDMYSQPVTGYIYQ